MNAATKGAGTKRAAFAIEGAIEETRRRIAGSAKDLQSKAEAAFQRPEKIKGVAVRNFNWGGIFTGTKTALIRAELAAPDAFRKIGKEYRLPLNSAAAFCAAVASAQSIPPAWDAEVRRSEAKTNYFDVWVSYNSEDLSIRERTDAALVELAKGRPDMQRVFDLVSAIPPKSLGELLPAAIRHAARLEQGRAP